MRFESILLVAASALLLSCSEKDEGQNTTRKDPGNGPIPYVYPDEKGDIIPDFSCVGYHCGDEPVPYITKIAATVKSPGPLDATQLIQKAIDTAGTGVVYLSAGTYYISGTITLNKSGIVLRGEGDATRLIATGTTQRNLIDFGEHVDGKNGIVTMEEGKTRISEDYVPLGRKWVEVEDASGFRVGELVTVFREGTENWIHDLRMDQIPDPDGSTTQWKPSSYAVKMERYIVAIEENKIYLDAPTVMSIDSYYGGGYVKHSHYMAPRIMESGVENLYMESEYKEGNETDENHCRNAVSIRYATHCWVRNVTAVHFVQSTVSIGPGGRNISVEDCKNLDPISQITGSRRYSFSLVSRGAQLCLFKNCISREGRHDFVTGALTIGPHVFTKCSATGCHADTGPHQRWACGILYDCVKTDGSINAQDRASMGSGHGWAGANQVFWNCESKRCACQSPWVSAKNWSIGYIGEKWAGNYNGRPNGEWYSKGTHVTITLPSTRTTESLYEAQMKIDHENLWSIIKDFDLK